MKYPLFDYQRTAADEVARNLAKASRRYREDDERSSFALTATTGAGKTVIASAVIEALFMQSEVLAVEPDPTAVVLWLTDDASLNNQTRHSMIRSSDMDPGQLITIDNEGFPERLTPGHVYFLNVQKLYDGSTKYTKRKDKRGYTLWNTIAHTIDDPGCTLYLVLDEAHKGMKQTDDRSTTVQRVVNGHDDCPAVPVVWGISATTERFTKAMDAAAAKGRTRMPDVEVPLAEVQKSGLLKDAIILNNPDEDGQFDTTFLRDAVHKTLAQSERWAAYCEKQNFPVVLPLLVVQVGNTPSDADLKRFVGTVDDEWPDLPPTAIANVFGEHADLEVASRKIRYVSPEDVQDDVVIRVLLAKDAVTTGWDCPRAEVLCSMRGGQDPTYITQLIGRMVRTPLAHRVPSDDLLNSVVCLLPHFNKKTTKDVALRLTNGNYDSKDSSSQGGGGPRTLRVPVTLTRNSAVPQAVFDLFATLPSEPKPSPLAKPVPRMLSMATALAGDGLLADANETAMKQMYAVLDGEMAKHRAVVDANIAAIKTAEIANLTLTFADGVMTETTSTLPADVRTIDDAFSVATRALNKAVATGYQKFRAERDAEPDGTRDLIQAKLEVAALGMISNAVEAVKDEAQSLTTTWFAAHDARIKLLDDERRLAYNSILAQASQPVHRDTSLQDIAVEESVDSDGQPLRVAPKHLLCEADGTYPVGGLNNWEQQAINTELTRESVVGWYRNPSNATEHAIQVPYRKGDRWATVQPDLIFFDRKGDGSIAASIIDPHGDFLGDAMDKLRGLADFAEKHAGAYLRVDSLALNARAEMVKLDMTRADVRYAVRQASKPSDLFNSKRASKYV